MNAMKSISGRQFAVFRMILGGYLTLHFAQLAPYAADLFSAQGMIGDAKLNFTYGILPNPLEHWGSPAFATGFVIALAVISLAYAAGFWRRTCAVVLWFGWACLFNRNNLISNPSIPYVGLLLLLTALVPIGEPWSVGRRNRAWAFPASVYAVAWILMAVGYSFSGWMKCVSPSWQDGTALWHVLQNPLARPGMVRDLMLNLPDGALPLLGWGCVAAELLFLPLSLHRCTRMIAWVSLCFMHAGILLVVDFADLSIGMLMIHAFTFDPGWLGYWGWRGVAGQDARRREGEMVAG